MDFAAAGGVGGQWLIVVNTTGAIRFTVANQAGTQYHAVSSAVARDTWIHVVGTLNAGTVTLYLNGVSVATAAFTGTGLYVPATGPAFAFVGDNLSNTAPMKIDELACYRYALPLARIQAHYTAGVARGFPRGQLAGQRMGAVLDSIGSHAPRSLRAGARPLAGQYSPGHPVLEALREAENAEAVDAVMFTASDGTLTFLDGGPPLRVAVGHRPGDVR